MEYRRCVPLVSRRPCHVPTCTCIRQARSDVACFESAMSSKKALRKEENQIVIMPRPEALKLTGQKAIKLRWLVQCVSESNRK